MTRSGSIEFQRLVYVAVHAPEWAHPRLLDGPFAVDDDEAVVEACREARKQHPDADVWLAGRVNTTIEVESATWEPGADGERVECYRCESMIPRSETVEFASDGDTTVYVHRGGCGE